jgi:hypothetical protein
MTYSVVFSRLYMFLVKPLAWKLIVTRHTYCSINQMCNHYEVSKKKGFYVESSMGPIKSGK